MLKVDTPRDQPVGWPHGVSVGADTIFRLKISVSGKVFLPVEKILAIYKNIKKVPVNH